MTSPSESTSTPAETPLVPSEENSSEQSAEQTPESKPKSSMTDRFRSLADGFKERADKFIREHFKGEHVEGQPTEMNKTEIAKAVGVGMIGAAASLGGIKSFADLPRWFAQKYYTKQEQQRIKQSIDTAVRPDREHATLKLDSGEDPGWEIVEEFEDGKIRVAKTIEGQGRVAKIVEASQLEKERPPSPVEIKKRRIERAVRESKYLSAEKKQELLQKLQDTVETYDNELQTYEKRRNEEIAKLLDEAIQTRVKGTTALKETLNTAMIATGLNVLRGAAYGAVALYERAVKVKQEMAKGERTEGFAKELVVKGFGETWDDLRFKTGDTKTKKALNFAKALGTVARFAGFTGLAVGEMSGTGGPSAAIDKALAAFEQKGVAGAAADNVSAHFERLGNIATLGLLKEDAPSPDVTATSETTQAESQAAASADTSAKAATEPTAPEAATSPAETGDSTEQTETTEPEAATEAPTEAVPEQPTELEPIEITAGKPLPEELSPEELAKEVAAEQEAPLTAQELEAGKVKSGDGVIRIVQRQLKLNPEKYGYTGDPSDKRAIAGWVRKTAFRMTKDAGFVHKGGGLGVYGKAIDNMALGVSQGPDGKMQINFYDAKSGEQISEQIARERGFVRDFVKETETAEPQKSANEILGDIRAAAEPEAATLEPATEEPGGLPKVTDDTRVVDAAEVPPNGLPEAGDGTVVVDQEPTFTDDGTWVEPVWPKTPPVEVSPTIETHPTTPLETFKSPQGTIQFKYNGDKISGAAFDYAVTSDDIDRAAERFGTGEYEIHRLYTGKFPQDQMWRANAPAKEFLETMERETRLETMMKDMAAKGMKDTPEYKYLERQAGTLKGMIKQTFKELGMQEQVDQVDRATLTVEEQKPTDTEVTKLRPPEPLEESRRVQPEIEASAPVEKAAAVPPPEQPAPELTKGPGGLEFTSAYTPEEQAKIADYINRGRLENAATAKLLAEYQSKYGDRPAFAAFKAQVEQRIQNQERHLAGIIEKAAGRAEGKPVIEIQGGISPAQAAEMGAQNTIGQVDVTTKLTSVEEKADDIFGELDKANESVEAVEANDEFVPEMRAPKLITPENPGETPPPGYHEAPTPKGRAFVEDTPPGYTLTPTPKGSMFVQKVPDGYKAVPTPHGMKYYKIKEAGS